MSHFRIFLFLPLLALAAGNPTISSLPANSWYQVPNTHLYDVRPAGWSGNVMCCWSGGAFDTQRSRLIIFGGGHNDYNGNEVYAFRVDSLKWVRLTNPSASPNYCSAANSDGTPNSRHTYNGLAYIAHADRLFADGGALACPSGGCGGAATFAFSFASNTWSNRNPTGTRPSTNCENAAAYDPATKRVFWTDGPGLYSYHYDTNVWAKHNSTSDQWGRTGAVDTKRKLLFFIGRGNVHVYDIGSANYTLQNWTTTGGSSVVGAQSPGMVYDPVSDRIVAFNGGSVYALNPDTKVWTATTASGSPTANAQGGVYGRWQYVPDCNAFIFVNAIDQNVYFYKLTAGGGNMPAERPFTVSGTEKNGPAGVFDIRGREVARDLHAANLRAGIYLVRVSGQKVRPVVIIK